jgi:hypothetical protein
VRKTHAEIAAIASMPRDYAMMGKDTIKGRTIKLVVEPQNSLLLRHSQLHDPTMVWVCERLAKAC